MSGNTIIIPRYVEGKEFYANDLEDGLRNCQKEGYEAQFMPAIADARIAAPKDSRVWKSWYTATSLKATGRTKQGNAVVIYAHMPNHFSNPDNIKKAKQQDLINGAGVLPEKEFQRLLELEDGKNVFAIDYNKLRSSESGIIKIKKALEHPQTIPFLGGSERAEKYLKMHEDVYGDGIGIWHSDDLRDNPMGRLLFLGDFYYYDLYGYGDLDYDGRFVGVRAEGAAQKIMPSLEEKLLHLSKRFVPGNCLEQYEKELKKLFK